MANVLVFIDLRDGTPTSPCRFALGEARRVASSLGATVYAVVTTGNLTAEAIEDLAADLGSAGADKIVLCADPALQRPALDDTHGAVLRLLAQRLRPLLFLFPAGSAGAELGPPLAARTQAAFYPRTTLELLALGETGTQGDAENGYDPVPDRLVLRYTRARKDRIRIVDLSPAHRTAPVVACLAAGVPATATGGVEPEVQMLNYPANPTSAVDEISSVPDHGASALLASTLVLVATTTELPQTQLPGVATVAADNLPATLGRACPSLIIGLAQTDVTLAAHLTSIGFAPDTHVALVGATDALVAPPEFVDRLWPLQATQQTDPMGEIRKALGAREQAR